MQSIWERNGIAELEYCKINRAAQLLSCDVDDILHWAVKGNIQVCVKVSDLLCKLIFPVFHGSIESLIKFLTDIIVSNRPSEVIKTILNGGVDKPLVAIYPDMSFDFSNESDVRKFLDLLMQKSGFPFSIDGLWVIEGSVFDDYDYDNPPCLGGELSEERNDFVKTLDFLKMEIPDATRDLLLKTSFTLQSPDFDDIESFKAIVGLLDKPLKLNVSNLYLTKKQIEKIYTCSINGSWDGILPNKPLTINERVTTKQSSFTVSLLREIGLTYDDLKGSITALRQKISRLAPSAPVPDDDKSIIDWLRKGGVER